MGRYAQAGLRRTPRRMLAAGAASWWLSGGISPANAIAAYQPIGAASLAASYINLANPGTYNAAPGVAPGWDAVNGWICDGTKYLTTGIIPTLDQTWSAIVRFSNITSPGRPFGLVNATSRFYVYIDTTLLYVSPANGGNLALVTNAPSMTSGTYGFAGINTYRNGTPDIGNIPVDAGSSPIELYICARNDRGAPNSYISGNIQALAIYNITLTAPQVAAVHTAAMALPIGIIL